MTPDLATPGEEVVFPETGRTAQVYHLTPGVAFKITNGEWNLEKLTPGALRSVEYSFQIAMIRGRACAVFTVHGQDQFAQPINNNMTAAEEKRIRREAREERAKAPLTPPPPPAAPPPTEPSPGPSKAAARLARMRAKFK